MLHSVLNDHELNYTAWKIFIYVLRDKHTEGSEPMTFGRLRGVLCDLSDQRNVNHAIGAAVSIEAWVSSVSVPSRQQCQIDKFIYLI